MRLSQRPLHRFFTCERVPFPCARKAVIQQPEYELSEVAHLKLCLSLPCAKRESEREEASPASFRPPRELRGPGAGGGRSGLARGPLSGATASPAPETRAVLRAPARLRKRALPTQRVLGLAFAGSPKKVPPGAPAAAASFPSTGPGGWRVAGALSAGWERPAQIQGTGEPMDALLGPPSFSSCQALH